MNTVLIERNLAPSTESLPEQTQIIGHISELSATDPLYVDLNNAITEEVIELDGLQLEMQEVCRLESEDKSLTYSVLRQTKEDGYVIRKRRNSESTTDPEEASDEFIKFKNQADVVLEVAVGGDKVRLSLDKKKQILQVGREQASQEIPGSDIVVVAGTQDRSPKKLSRTFEDSNEQHQKARKRRNRYLALGFLASFAANGPIDQALDAFNSPSSVVSDAVENETENLIIRTHQLTDVERQRIETVMNSTMQDLDDGNFDVIRERAEAFRSSYPEGSFLSLEQVDELKDGLNSAQSFEDITNLLSPFLARYGVDFQINTNASSSGASLESARRYALGIIDVFNIFPSQPKVNNVGSNISSSLRDLFGVRIITMRSDMSSLTNGKAGPLSGEIDLNINSTNEFIGNFAFESEPLFGGNEPKTVFAHELGHMEHHDRQSLFELVDNDTKVDVEKAISSFFGGSIDYRVVPTMYSLKSKEEERAEKFSELLADGVEDPNRTIAFLSPMNRDLMESLVYFEASMPGFTDQLIEHTTLSHANDGKLPHVEGFYRLMLFNALLLSLYANRDKTSSRNLLRRAGLES